uniref:Efflux ABC transporter, ATP-binding protein n=1 Tax=uncultured Nocardioidaceae bacterium TaxID=253824 RepID=A0A6J4L0Y9_9ACTN|nr:MAG: Efflux ABC transporter, ATP-binding protein [uncultured Nocardioidaceae bacterium]
MSVIEVRDLTRTFVVRERRGVLRREARMVHAVADVSFDVEAGEAVGYIGPNGAGKSTTIKMLTGILVPTSGSLTVAGLDPSRSRTELARRIGVVFGQRTGLWWDLPLRESFELLRRIYRVPVPTYQRNLAAFVELLDLQELLSQPVRQLSLGQRMRGDIVAALLHDPQILYLDEPTIGLDLLSKQRLRGFLRDLNDERGTTILLTTHDLVDIEQVCRRVMVIDRGRLAFDGDFAALHAAGEATRMVVVDFAEPMDAVSVPGATVTRVDGVRQWLTVPAGAATGPVVAALASAHEVADLSIREPSIEDVLPHLYAR